MVRILCPGRVSQQKLLDGFDKLKNLACFHSKSGAEKVVPKKTQSAPSAGGRAALTPTSTRSAVVPKPVKQEAKKVGSATSLEHKANDVTKKQDIKKPAIAKESARKPQHLDHGRAAAKASPQKSPTKITKTAGSKEPRAIKGSAEKRAETKPVPASLDKEEKAQGVEVEGQLSAKESKGQEAKETEDVSSTAVTPSSTEEKPEEAAGESRMQMQCVEICYNKIIIKLTNVITNDKIILMFKKLTFLIAGNCFLLAQLLLIHLLLCS